MAGLSKHVGKETTPRLSYMPASAGLPSVCQGEGGVKPDQLSTAQQLNQTWEAALNAEKAMCSAATAAEDPLCNSRMEEKETECEGKRKTEQTACDAKKTTANTKCDKNKETWKKESEAECLKKTEEAEKCGSFFCFFFLLKCNLFIEKSFCFVL